MENKIDMELKKLYKIKEMVDKLIGIPNSEKYSIKQLREEYYKKNPDIFQNLINAYNHISKFTDENQKLIGYDILTESDKQNKYNLINAILEVFSRSNSSSNRTVKGEMAKEENIYLYFDFEQFVGDNIISIKDIKQKWNRYSKEEQDKIIEIAKSNFDTHVWVLKDTVDEAIENTNKDKIEFQKNKKENDGEDIDI